LGRKNEQYRGGSSLRRDKRVRSETAPSSIYIPHCLIFFGSPIDRSGKKERLRVKFEEKQNSAGVI